MKTAQVIVESMLNDDDPFIETEHPVRPDTAKRLERLAGIQMEPGTSMQVNIGSHTYRAQDGKWTRLRRKRNPAWAAKPNHYVLVPHYAPKFEMIFVQSPRLITSAKWHKGIRAILRDALGKPHSISQGDLLVDPVEGELFQARVTGEKPEKAYRMGLDGNVERLH